MEKVNQLLKMIDSQYRLPGIFSFKVTFLSDQIIEFWWPSYFYFMLCTVLSQIPSISYYLLLPKSNFVTFLSPYSFYWYSAPAMTPEIRYGSSTFLETWVYRLAFPPNRRLEKANRIWTIILISFGFNLFAI